MDSEELELEQEVAKDKRKRETVKPAIYDINGMYGIKFDDTDVMTLQKKVKYQDGGEGWSDDGYFTSWPSIFKEVLSATPKAVAVKHGGGDLQDLIRIVTESTKKVDEWFKIRI